MQISEIAEKLNRPGEIKQEISEDCRKLFSQSCDLVSRGKFSEAKRAVKGAIECQGDFDEGLMFLGLIIFAEGDRISGIKTINRIADADVHKTAMEYVDLLSEKSNAQKPEKAPLEELDKTRINNKIKVEIPESAEEAESREQLEFSKRFKKAKERQNAELEKKARGEVTEKKTDLSGDTLTAGQAKFVATKNEISKPEGANVEGAFEKIEFVKTAPPKPAKTTPPTPDNAMKLEIEEAAQKEPIEEKPREKFQFLFDDYENDSVAAATPKPEPAQEQAEPAQKPVEQKVADDADDDDDDGEDAAYIAANCTNKQKTLKYIIITAISVAIVAIVAFVALKTGR